MVIEALVEKDWEGTIAIDDLSLSYDRCPDDAFCDFETADRYCTWSNEKYDDEFDWEVRNRHPLPIDHTLLNEYGHYLFADPYPPRIEGDEAWLTSMIFSISTEKCFRFWFSMNGNGVGTVKVVVETDDYSKKTIWQLTADKGDGWHLGEAGFITGKRHYR